MLTSKLKAVEKKIQEIDNKHRQKVVELNQSQEEMEKEMQKAKRIKALMLIDKGALLEIIGMLDIANAVLLGLTMEFRNELLNKNSEHYQRWERIGAKVLQEYKGRR